MRGSAASGFSLVEVMISLGLTLLVMTLVFNIDGYILRKRFREVY